MDDWIEKFNSLLDLVQWNDSLAGVIQDYLNHKVFTATAIDGLLMSATKITEASLRDAVAKYTTASVPAEESYGPNLLNYAKSKGFIPEPKRGSDSIYSLIYWYFEKPRNSSHHFFTNFPLPTIVTFISTANFILNEIERLSSQGNYYTAKTIFDYNTSTLLISVADIKKGDATIIPPVLEANLVNPEKAMKAYPLQRGEDCWYTRIGTEGLMKGTYSVHLWGNSQTETFRISGSAIVVV